MRRIVLVLAATLATTAWAQQAPFCVVTDLNTQCFYYTLSTCQQAARGVSGMCTANPQGQASSHAPYDISRAIQHPDIVGSAIRAGEDGTRQRQAEEEHQATMSLIETQIRSRQQAAHAKQETNDGYWVMYKCAGADGAVKFSGVPEVGCVVVSVTAY